MNWLKSLTGSATVLTLAAATSQASLLTYEGFDYAVPTANISGSAGGSGWYSGTAGTNVNNSWFVNGAPAPTPSVTTGLIYTDGLGNNLSTVGGGLLNNAAGTVTPYAQRTLGPGTASPIAGSTFGSLAGVTTTTGGTLWMSYLWSSGDTGTSNPAGGNNGLNFREAKIAFHAVGTEYLDLGMPNIGSTVATGMNQNPNFSLWAANGTALTTLPSTASLQSSVAINNSNTFLVVIKMTLGNSSVVAADTIEVWLNPNLNAAPDVSLITPTLTYSGQDLNPITNIRVQSGLANGTNLGFGKQIADEIRLGTTFADVAPIAAVPEPGAVGVAIGLGMGLLVALRRRKQALA